MDKQLLTQFWENSPIRDAVRGYFDAYIREYIVREILRTGDGTGLKEAERIVTGAWNELEKEVSQKRSKGNTNPV